MGHRDALMVSGPKRGEIVTVSRNPMELWTTDRGDWAALGPDDPARARRELWTLRQLQVGDRSFWVLSPEDCDWTADAVLALIDAAPETVKAVEVRRT